MQSKLSETFKAIRLKFPKLLEVIVVFQMLMLFFVSPYVKYAKNQLYKVFSLKRKWKNGKFLRKKKIAGKKQKK
jgi:hypothetical protein